MKQRLNPTRVVAILILICELIGICNVAGIKRFFCFIVGEVLIFFVFTLLGFISLKLMILARDADSYLKNHVLIWIAIIILLADAIGLSFALPYLFEWTLLWKVR